MSVRQGYRERRARERLGMQSIDADPGELHRIEELIDAHDLRDLLVRLVNDLPPGERDAVLARVIHEQEYEAISRERGVTEAAMRQRVSRGLAKLAVAIRREGI